MHKLERRNTVCYCTWCVRDEAAKEESYDDTEVGHSVGEYTVLENGYCSGAAHPDMGCLTAHNHKVPAT